MLKHNFTRHIVTIEVLGFGLIILLTWLDELIALPALLFGGEHPADYHEASLESLITLCIAIPVILATRRLLKRLHYLEGFLQVCAWCRKVEHNGQWMMMEEYFRHRFNTLTSHGMCPECFAKVKADNKEILSPAGGSDAARKSCQN